MTQIHARKLGDVNPTSSRRSGWRPESHALRLFSHSILSTKASWNQNPQKSRIFLQRLPARKKNEI
jgi:hypothetical protein